MGKSRFKTRRKRWRVILKLIVGEIELLFLFVM